MVAITRKQGIILAGVLILAFIILFMMENYYSSPAKPRPTESFYSLPVELSYTKFPNIVNYLENAEEISLEKDEQAGCFDNDRLLENIKGDGQTCKSWAPKVKNIYFKKEKGVPVPVGKLDDYFPSSEGREYSFAELCPVTTNQDLPLNCLYKKSAKFNELSSRVAGVIDKTQAKNSVMLDSLDDAISYHIVDNNRLYNMPHVRDFLVYERGQNMNRGLRNSNEDYLDDLSIYAKKVKGRFA